MITTEPTTDDSITMAVLKNRRPSQIVNDIDYTLHTVNAIEVKIWLP